MKPKFLSLIVLIERFARKFGHHTARQNTAQGCKKSTFAWLASGAKRFCSSSLLKCWIISCRTLYLYFSFSLDLQNLRQAQGTWICGIPFTRVFIPPSFSWPSNISRRISIIHLLLIPTDFTRGKGKFQYKFWSRERKFSSSERRILAIRANHRGPTDRIHRMQIWRISPSARV